MLILACAHRQLRNTEQCIAGGALKTFFWSLLSGTVCLILPAGAESESLRDAVRYALTTNPEIAAAASEATASKYEMLELQGEYLPVVSLYGDAGAQRVDDPSSLSFVDNDTTQFRRQVRVESELVLFDGFRRANLVYANAARTDGSIYRLLDASETIALNATEVYIDVYRHLQLQAAAERNLASHREITSRVSDLVDGGRLPVSDLLQAQDRTRAAQIALVDIQQAGLDAEARYERIIGRKRAGAMSVPGATGNPGNLDQLLSKAVARNFRIQVATTEVNRAAYQKNIRESDRQPRVTFNYGLSYGDDLDGVTGTQTDAYVGFRMSWILSRGGRRAQTQALIERQSKALSERHLAIREVREMAERTWVSYRANAEKARILSGQLTIAGELVDQYGNEFLAGTRTLLDLLDAERSRFSVEFEKISADASLQFSGYRMLAAQSRLAAFYGVDPKGEALIPNFEQRARVKPTAVFKTQLPPLE